MIEGLHCLVYIQGCNSDNSWGSIIWPGGRLVPYHLHAAAIWERWMTADVEFPTCKIIIQLLGLESTAVWWSVTLHIVPSSQDSGSRFFYSWKCRINNYFWLWKWSSHKRRFPRHQMKVSACFVLPWLMGGGRFWRPVKQISGDSSSPGITVLGSRRSLFSRKMWKCVEDDKVVIKFR